MDLVSPIVNYVVDLFNQLVPIFALYGAYHLGAKLVAVVKRNDK